MGIGRVLSRLIKERGTNVHELASKAGIKPSTLYSIIQRDSVSANVRDLWRIAHMLDITLDYFYELIQIDIGEAPAEIFEDEYAQWLRRPYANGMPPEEVPANCSAAPAELDALLKTCEYYQVTDDSMAPDYVPGDVVVIRPGVLPELGEDGVFVRNGNIMLRRRVAGALLAADPRLEPIAYPSRSPFESYGTVIGRLKEHA